MNKQLDAHTFLTSNFGINVKDNLSNYLKIPDEGVFSRKQIYKVKQNAPKLEEFLSEYNLRLEPGISLSQNMADFKLNRDMVYNKYTEELKELKDEVHHTAKDMKRAKKRERLIERELARVGKFDHLFNEDHHWSSMRNPRVISAMGSLAFFIDGISVYNKAIRNDSKVLVYIDTGAFQLFYDIKNDYLTTYCPRLLTPDYVRKNKIAPDDIRGQLPPNISDIKTAAILTDSFKLFELSYEDVNNARLNAFRHFKRKYPSDINYNSYEWVTNYRIDDTRTLLVSDDVLAMIVMCLSFRDNKRRNALKRLFATIIHFNSNSYQTRLGILRSKKIRKTGVKKTPKKPIKIAKLVKNINDNVISSETKHLKQLNEMPIIKEKLKNKVIKNVKTPSTEFDDAVNALVSIIDGGDRLAVRNLEGGILFWVFLNLGLFNLTNFLDTTPLAWRKDSYANLMSDNKQNLSRIIEVIDYIRFYYLKDYKRRNAQIDDLQIELPDTEYQKELFLKTNRGVGPIVFLFKDNLIGWVLARNYFMIHGQLNN